MNAHRVLKPAAALVLGAVVAGVCAAAAAAAPPSNTRRPSLSGTLRDGSTLTAYNGRWTNNPTSFGYEWLRCGSGGANCVQIAGANNKRYTLTSADVGHRMRIEVIATNSSGSTSATSGASGIVRAVGSQPHNTSSDGAGANCAAIPGATGQTYNLTTADVVHTMRVTVRGTNKVGSNPATSHQTALVAPASSGGAAISVSTVALPDRLFVDNVKFSPQPLGSRRTLTGRFHVADTRGFSVQGALVYAIGLPYGWTRNTPEVTTDGNGWATVAFTPTRRLPLQRGTYLVVFVRARKPGDSTLAGVSSRRLVQARIR